MRTGIWWGNLREGAHLKDPGVDGTIILKWILKKWNSSGSVYGKVVGCCERGCELSGS